MVVEQQLWLAICDTLHFLGTMSSAVVELTSRMEPHTSQRDMALVETYRRRARELNLAIARATLDAQAYLDPHTKAVHLKRVLMTEAIDDTPRRDTFVELRGAGRHNSVRAQFLKDPTDRPVLRVEVWSEDDRLRVDVEGRGQIRALISYLTAGLREFE